MADTCLQRLLTSCCCYCCYCIWLGVDQLFACVGTATPRGSIMSSTRVNLRQDESRRNRPAAGSIPGAGAVSRETMTCSWAQSVAGAGYLGENLPRHPLMPSAPSRHAPGSARSIPRDRLRHPPSTTCGCSTIWSRRWARARTHRDACVVPHWIGRDLHRAAGNCS